MHSSAAIAFLGSLASASVLPRQYTASSRFKLESRLANGTSMGYFTPTVGGGAWYGTLVDDVSDATSVVLTDPSPEKASLIVPKDPSNDLYYWDIAWTIGTFESDQPEWVALERKEDVNAWTVGFGIDGDDDNRLTYDGPQSPLIFGGEFEGSRTMLLTYC